MRSSRAATFSRGPAVELAMVASSSSAVVRYLQKAHLVRHQVLHEVLAQCMQQCMSVLQTMQLPCMKALC